MPVTQPSAVRNGGSLPDLIKPELIKAVKQPLSFFALALVAVLVLLITALRHASQGVQGWVAVILLALMFLLVIGVGALAVLRKDALYRPTRERTTVTVASVSTVTAERTSGDRLPLPGEDKAPPAAGVWYKDIRPVLHQAIQYTVPTYYLDMNLMIVDWNIAFDLIFSRLGAKLRDSHVKYFINELLNFEDVMDHAQEFTRKVLSGRIPFIDVEPLRYASERYGEVSFVKIAAQLHGPDGQPKGWSVSLMIKEIDWPAFERDLLEEARKDKLWGVYSASYDRVLLEFEPYKQLIRDVIDAVPRNAKSVVDLGAGTGNTTRELLTRGYAVTAVENNLGMLDTLRAKKLTGKLTVVKSSIEDLATLNDSAFDAAVMVNVLYAVDDPFACLQSVYRILKPGGWLALSTTHSESELDVLLNSIKVQLSEAGKFESLAGDYQLLHDVNKLIEKDIAKRHARDKYCEWIRAAGFKIEKKVSDTYEDAVMLIWARKA